MKPKQTSDSDHHSPNKRSVLHILHIIAIGFNDVFFIYYSEDGQSGRQGMETSHWPVRTGLYAQG